MLVREIKIGVRLPGGPRNTSCILHHPFPACKQKRTEPYGHVLSPRDFCICTGTGLHGNVRFPQPCSYTFRNKDFQEVTLKREGQVLLRFAVAYGFRNIQNLVQKLKRGRCPYHYVEVMACPSGSSS